MINFLKSSSAVILIIISSAIIFGLTLKGELGNVTAYDMKDTPEYSLRDRGRYLLIENLMQKHSFALNRQQADLAAPDAGYYNGNWYLLYPPGISLLALPFYELGSHYNLSQVASFSMAGVFSIGNLIFIFLIARQIVKLPVWASIFAALTFGFASDALGYSTNLFQHFITVFFIVSGFYAVYRYKIHRRWGFLWGFYVWLAYGLTIFVDYPNALLMLPVIVYFILAALSFTRDDGKYRVKIRISIILTSILFLGVMAVHGYYNQVNFGGWTKLSGSLVGYREGVDTILDQGGNVQDIKSLGQKKNLATAFRESYFVNGIYELLFAYDKGLFVYSPVFIFGFLGMLLAAIKKQITLEIGILIAIFLTTLFLYASWGDPYGGWSFGPRYLIPGIPPLAIFVSYWLVKVPFYKVANWVAVILLYSYSVAVAVLGAITTNVVPPKIEAVVLHQPYGLDYNFQYIMQGKTNGFAFNYFFNNHFSLINYYFLVLSIVLGFSFFVLVVLPILGRLVYKLSKRREVAPRADLLIT
jgi:hypothetical protein